MERRLVLNGLLAGLVAGVVAFLYARFVGEPLIAEAINFESGRAAAENALAHANDVGHSHGDDAIVTRATQAGWGLAAGVIGYAVALGAIFSVVYAACLGRFPRTSPQTLAILLALGGFVAINLLPFMKYPANPPAVSLDETSRPRGGYYLLLVIASVALLVLAVWVARRVMDRSSTIYGLLAGGGTWVVGAVAALLIFPSTGSLSGLDRAAETPLPLTDESGVIVFPGFPADLLYDFRVYSLILHLIVWVLLGVVFGALVRRTFTRAQTPRDLEEILTA